MRTMNLARIGVLMAVLLTTASTALYAQTDLDRITAELARNAERAVGSISGRVVNAAGTPLEGATVEIRFEDQTRTEQTGPGGRYSLQGIPAGTYMISAELPGEERLVDGFPTRSPGPRTRRSITLAAGADLENITLTLVEPVLISGTVVDQNGEPVANHPVQPVLREYQDGQIAFLRAGLWATTDENGAFALSVSPGRSYLILSGDTFPGLPADTVPEYADAGERPTMFRPTYYPNAPVPEAASPIQAIAGAHIDGIRIQTEKVPAYCISGRADPDYFGTLWARFVPRWPATGQVDIIADRAYRGEENFALCGFAPGEYLINRGVLNNRSLFAIVDRDIELDLTTPAKAPMTGSIEWARGTPAPDSPVTALLSVPGDSISVQIPGTFTTRPVEAPLPGPATDPDGVGLEQLPQGAYLEEISYAGGTVLNLTVALDGARLQYTAIEEAQDDAPVADAWIVRLPQGIANDAELAARIQWSRGDQNGVAQETRVRPGDYVVLAVRAQPNRSPEYIAALRRAAAQGERIEIGPSASLELRVPLIEIE